jgi:RHS repeat-associated protein
VATYDAQGGTRFQLADALGGRRVQAHVDGTAGLFCFNYPFGDGLNCWGGDEDATEHHFTGKERDSESGNDYFGARYYASTMGRFMSPDPLQWLGWQHGNSNDRAKFAAFIGNPQSLNLYAYVNNNPLNKTDPTGLYICNGNAQQCQAVQNSLDAIKRAADTLSKGTNEEQALGKKLNGILSFYGKAGDANGVKVGFADLASHGAWGSTHSSSFFGLFKSTTITFDYHAFNQGYAFGAETAAHEGAHGVDGPVDSTFFGTPKWSGMLGTETHAYQAEAAVDRGLGTATASDGDSPVWNPGWGAAAAANSANAINANATSNAAASCAASGGCDGQPQQ